MAASALAQESAYDRIVVDLPANTWVGGEKLAAGRYEMRQLPSPGVASNIILVNVKSHRKWTAQAVSIRALKNVPLQQTQVILQRVGNDYYLDHIWIAGKEWGYRFEVPAEAQPEDLTLTATYSTPPPVVAEAAPPPPPPAPPAEVAPPPPPPAEQPAPEAAPPPPPPAPELPHTASNWPLELAGALVCLAIGLTMGMLRRLRS